MEIPDQTGHNRPASGSQRLNRPSFQLSTPPQKLGPMTNKVFRLERDGNVLIVIPQGDANGFRYHDVHQESNTTLQALDDPSLQHVVVDFKAEIILGSIMISVVIKMCRKATGKGGKAVFCSASENMLDVLTTMNLTKLWPHYPTRSEAIAAVRAG